MKSGVKILGALLIALGVASCNYETSKEKAVEPPPAVEAPAPPAEEAAPAAEEAVEEAPSEEAVVEEGAPAAEEPAAH